MDTRLLKILEQENVIKKEKDANLIKINLKNHPLTIAYLKQAHTENFLALPKKNKYLFGFRTFSFINN